MIVFDPTVNAGQIATIAATLAGGGIVLWRMVRASWENARAAETARSDIARTDKNVLAINVRLDGVDGELKKQTEILLSLAAFGARLNNVEIQNNELRQEVMTLIRKSS